MGMPQPTAPVSVEDYLAFERSAEYKHEYLDGVIRAMTGASMVHNTIAHNIGRVLGNQLLNGPCAVVQSDQRVRIKEANSYCYPDIVGYCGEAEMEDGHFDTLLNPTLIIEILSPSTESYDRGDKFRRYQRIAGLKDYLLVAQDHMAVDHYRRHDLGWFYQQHDQADAVIELESVGASLTLEDIYHRVRFPEPEDESGSPDEADAE